MKIHSLVAVIVTLFVSSIFFSSCSKKNNIEVNKSLLEHLERQNMVIQLLQEENESWIITYRKVKWERDSLIIENQSLKSRFQNTVIGPLAGTDKNEIDNGNRHGNNMQITKKHMK